jgi:DNA-binding transcriptional LysR family regulator
LRSAHQTALSEQVDADLIFILSGAHIGFLPEHAARPWVEQNKLRALLEPELGYNAQFQLATSRAHNQSEALKAFIHDLLPKVGRTNTNP